MQKKAPESEIKKESKLGKTITQLLSNDLIIKMLPSIFSVVIGSLIAFGVSMAKENKFRSLNLGRPLISNIGYKQYDVTKQGIDLLNQKPFVLDSLIKYYGYVPEIYGPSYYTAPKGPILNYRLVAVRAATGTYVDLGSNIFTLDEYSAALQKRLPPGQRSNLFFPRKMFIVNLSLKNPGNVPLYIDSVRFHITDDQNSESLEYPINNEKSYLGKNAAVNKEFLYLTDLTTFDRGRKTILKIDIYYKNVYDNISRSLYVYAQANMSTLDFEHISYYNSQKNISN